MFIKIITIALCLSIVYADVEQLATTEAAISDKVDNLKLHTFLKHQKHHKKRHSALLNGIPPYKAGYDIPVVHHSFIKPLVVDYPTQRVPIGVKIPFKNPFTIKFPTALAHHNYFHAVHGFKHPAIERPIVLPGHHLHPEALKPVHHVHHHVVPAVTKPVVAVESATVHLPSLLPAPTTQIQFRPVKPAIVQPTQLLPAPNPIPLSPIPVTPQIQNIPLIQQAPLVPQVPLVQQIAVTPQVPYIIRPGNSVQTSYFATFPKHQIANFAAQAAFPVFQDQPVFHNHHVGQVGFHNHLLFPRPVVEAPHIDLLPPHHHSPQALIPQHNVQQHQVPTVINIPDSNVQVPDFQVPHHHHEVLIPQTPQPETNGWTAITTPTPAPTTAQTQPSYVYPVPNNQYDGSQIPVYEQPEEQHFHNQFEQHHYDQHNQFEQEHQFQQQDQYEHHHQTNQFDQDQAQFDGQQYHHEQQHQFHHQQQLPQEYGVPPQQRLDSNEYAEGRNLESTNNNFSESEESPPRNKFHNHIPLGLQLPLKTPSDFN